MRTHANLVALAGWLLLAPALPAAAPRFVAQRADGADVTGAVEEIAPDWQVKLGGTTIPAGSLVALEQAGKPRPPLPAGPHLVLAGGDRLPGKADALKGETLHFLPELGKERSGEWKLPLSSVALVWCGVPEGTTGVERFRRQLLAEKRTRDRVYLRNGDLLEGVLLGFQAAGELRIEVKGRTIKVEFAKVALLALNTELLRPPKTKRPYGRAVLASGARLSLASVQATDVRIKARTLHGAELAFAPAELIAIDMCNGPAVPLSDLKPARYEFRPFLDNRWDYVRDGSVVGNDLRVGGSVYEKGLGLHAAARLTYQLDGAYRRFEARVGLDDRTGSKGTARLRLLLDGKPVKLPGDGLLRGGAEPIALRADLAGVKELTLVVDFGPRGSVQAHVDVVDAWLLKK